MADNTTLPAGTGGDTIRTLSRGVGVPKTQVTQLDIGGASANSEVLLTAGQQLMAASLPVVFASNQTALPVTGTFYQATQPVSGSIAVTNFPASQAVTGAFFQATQPVSALSLPLPAGAATEATLAARIPVNGQALMAASVPVTLASNQPALPVTGTFFQATQPVSNASLPLPTGASTETTLAALNTKVTAVNTGAVVLATGAAVIGAVTQSGAWSVAQSGTWNIGTVTAVTAITNALPVGANTIGAVTNVNLDVALSTRLKPADTLAAVTTVGTVSAVTAITNALPAGANKIGTVDIATASATAKGTQGANGVPTQDLKDAGRSANNLFMVLPIVTTATDALQSLTGFAGTAAVAATTTPAVVTTAKTRRIDSITITYVAIATAGSAKVTLRAQAGGVVTITSPIVAVWVIGAPAAVAGVAMTSLIDFPNGMEFAAGTGLGISIVGLGATQVAAAVGYAQVAITGTEY